MRVLEPSALNVGESAIIGKFALSWCVSMLKARRKVKRMEVKKSREMVLLTLIWRRVR